MVGSRERYDVCMEAAGIALAAGDRADAERAFRGAIQAIEGLSDFNAELGATLVRLASLKQEAGHYVEAEDLFRKALDAGERALGSHDLGLVPALSGIGAARVLQGSPDQAHPFLARALDLSERHLGEGHPDLVILLNDLSRLYLKQSAFEYAEPLLLRLLALKRGKGEEHPEVATVLASLASLRQSLGRYDSAEQLWRRVLEIRERTLAPNHFSLATTLEHLATTLAARGKTREALQLYQRALSIRELTLGSDHPSLRASRERIADLQLQASEDSFAGGESAPSAAAPLRLSPGDRIGMPATATLSTDRPAAVLQRDPAAPDREVRSPVAAQLDREPVFGFEPAVPAVAFDRVDAPRPKPSDVSQSTAEDPPYLKVLLEIKDELEQTDSLARTAEHSGITTRAGALLAASAAFVRHRRIAVVLGVTIVALPLVAMAMAGVARSNPVSPREEAGYAVPAAPLTDSMLLAAATLQGSVARPVADVLRDSAIAPASKAAAPRSKGAEEASSSRTSAAAEEENWIPTLPRPTVARLDSVVGALATSRPAGPIVTLTLPSGSESSVRASGSDENANAPKRAQLIGSLPTPRYPAHLLLAKIGGEVVVRFQVDTTGRPVMNTLSVVSTPDPGLTAAVRRVIPSLRFEPARSPGPELRAITDVTELSFRFSPDTRE